MNKKLLSLMFATVLGMGAIGAATINTKAAKAEEPESYDILAEHNYFNGNCGDWGGNLLKDQDDGDGSDKYNRLTKTATNDNCWIMLDKEERHAGRYLWSADMRVPEIGANLNIGFGFWANGTINGRIHDTVVTSQLKAGEWAHVEVTFEFTETEATALDSIHMWVVNGTQVDYKNLKLQLIQDGQLEANIFKDVGFENVDVVAHPNGWNDRHSGVITSKANQVNWLSEGTKGEDGYNQFLRLTYGGDPDVNMVDWCSFLNDWNGSWPKGIPAGTYVIDLDVRPGELFDTGNCGLAIYSANANRFEMSLTDQVLAAKKGEWNHVRIEYPEMNENYASGVDSLQFWCGAKKIVGWSLDIDNVQVRRATLVVDNRPEFEGGVYDYDFIEADNKDLTINVSELHGYTDLAVKQGEYILDETEFTFADGILTIKKDFLNTLDDGVTEFTVYTTGGERTFTVEVTHKQEDLPNKDDYNIEETVFGGDFQDVNVGYRMNADQTENAWGAVSNYDDGGLVVEETDGTRALSFKKPADSTKSYASSFVIYHPQKIVENTVVSFSFDYKYTGAVTDDSVNVCFVGNSNVSYHLIPLNGSKAEKTKEPEAKYRTWDITYTDAGNGYTHVAVDMRIDKATVNATNSIRFLMKYNGNAEQELRIQNVSLKRWVKKLGSLITTEGEFDKGNPADVVIKVKFAEGLELYGVALDSNVSYIDAKNFSSELKDGVYTITISKDYLAKLTDGEHKIFVSSTEDESNEYAELEFKLTVKAAQKEESSSQKQDSSEPGEEPSKGCKGSIIATSALITVIAVAGFGFLKSKKED